MITSILLVGSSLSMDNTDITIATYNIDTNIVRSEEGFARYTHP